MSDYKVEFPSYDDVLPSLHGFHDSSWHNDSCPSITKILKDGYYVVIYCDYKDSNLSDWNSKDYNRYSVVVGNDNYYSNGQYVLQTNDWNSVKEMVSKIDDAFIRDIHWDF